MTATDFSICVDEFFADFKVQRLLDLARKTRPLQVCFPREIPVSRFLAWILDPSQGHGLQDTPIRRLLTAAWRNRDDSDLDLSIKRQISPATLATHSFLSCMIQTEIQFPPEKGKLDLLILVPKDKILIAIENKFGAGEGPGQLKKYTKSLAKKYPDWTRILIYLDLYGEAPGHSDWIGLDYAWLVEELSAAESSPWLGDESKDAIREFRGAIELDSDTFEHVSTTDGALVDVVQEHREVFECMAEWHRSGLRLPELVSKVYASSTTLRDKARQQLFPLYWQRSELWRICIPMLSYAKILATAQKVYPLVQQDPRRKTFYYSLPNWDWLRVNEARFWPLLVMIRILSPGADYEVAQSNGKFIAISMLDSRQVNPDYNEAALIMAQKLRAVHMKRNRQLKDEPGMITLRVDRANSAETISEILVKHLRMLETEVASLYINLNNS